MRSSVGQKVGVHRSEKDHVEGVIGKGEAVCRRGDVPVRVIRTTSQINMVKAECGMKRCDCPPAPRDCLSVDLDAVISTLEISNQPDSKVANA